MFENKRYFTLGFLYLLIWDFCKIVLKYNKIYNQLISKNKMAMTLEQIQEMNDQHYNKITCYFIRSIEDIKRLEYKK
jgi:hypothetical protein